MQRRIELSALFAALAAFILFVSACGGGGSGGDPAPAEPTGPEGPGPDEPGPVDPPPGRPQARLDRVAGCTELLDRLEGDASEKIRVQAEELRAETWNRGAVDFGGPVPEPTAPQDPGLESDGAPDDFTETNVQVEGVDEADFVETDGERIYLLHAESFVVIDSWPPEAAALESGTSIEGYPHSMFVADGRAVVFSTVYDSGEFGVPEDCRYIGPPEPLVDIALVGDIAPCLPTITKVTVIDVAAGPAVTRELYLEGSYSAARRHGSAVRVVTQGGHGLPEGVPNFWNDLYSGEVPDSQEDYEARVDAWEQAALAAISESALDDWLPGQWERAGGVLSPVAPFCEGVHVPPVGVSEHGMVRVLGFDMTADDGEIHDTVIVGGVTDVYASLERLVLAQRDWSFSDGGDRTALHLFGVSASAIDSSYLGSGYVPGVPHNQFSFDMQGDVLRVATTETREPDDLNAPWVTTNQIVTMQLDGDALEVLGTTGGVAPDEQIYSVRYIGDRGYMVTFRVIDPLFVVDLSDPANPTVLGELELPGFSEYMHPLGENHLLTIGQAADLEGRVTGLALRIFDVSDDTNPTLAHVHEFSGQGWSPANYDHRSFVFDAARGLLTFPYVSYEGDFRSTLQLFSVDSATGFSSVGEVDHTDLTESQCGALEEWQCAYAPEIRRGLFIEDFLYSISGAGVLAHSSGDLASAVATVPLPPSGGGGGLVLPGTPILE